MFNSLSELDCSKTTWRVKVRVTRMWPSVSNATNANDGLRGYNLILLDDADCHAHAFIYADTWRLLADKIDEGCVYVISGFYTKKPTGSLKPVSSPVLINFSNTTLVQKVEDDDFMIPRHKFEFLDFSDMLGIATANANVEYPEFSTDLIGALEGYDGLSKLNTVYGLKDISRFIITDGRQSARVTVWGQLALDTDVVHKSIPAGTIIIILARVKMKKFKDYIQVNTIPSTKIYLNLEDEAVSAMRQRLHEIGYVPPERSLSSPGSSSMLPAPTIDTISLKELSEKDNSEFIKRMFLCKATVKKVEEDESWWFDCCHKNNCNEEVSKLDGKFRCLKCQRNYPIPQKRFRIIVLAEDETEAFNIVLCDRAVKRIVGKTATKLIAERIDDQSDLKEYPSELKAIHGKELTFKIELTEDNILLRSTVYNATDAFDREVTASSKSEATTSDLEITGYKNTKYEDVADNGNTPGSAKSSNKKIKTET